MKRIALFAALALGLMATTAATCQTGSKPVDHVVDGVVECAKAGVHEVAVNIVDDAASALATGDWQTALGNLVKQFGEGAVDCAVAEIADTAGKHAAMNELEATKARRAKEWLASRPVKVVVSQSPAAEGRPIPLYGRSLETVPTTLSGLCPHGCNEHDRIAHPLN